MGQREAGLTRLGIVVVGLLLCVVCPEALPYVLGGAALAGSVCHRLDNGQ